MSRESEMNKLAEEIANTQDKRTRDLARLIDETARERQRAQEMFDDFYKQHLQMKSEQEAELRRQTMERKNEVSEMRAGFRTELHAVSLEWKKLSQRMRGLRQKNKRK